MTPRFSRRRLLQTGLIASTCGFARSATALADAPSAAEAIIDTHVYVGRWPFRQVSSDDSAELVAELRRNHVSQAWTGTFDGLLHKDIGSANRRLVDVCETAGRGLLIPFGTVNPTLPDWEEDVRRCHEVFHMSGIRLHPNYHGYMLDDPRFARLLALAAERSLIVQLVGWLDDEQHSYLQNLAVRVGIAPLITAARPLRGLTLVLANAIHTFKNKDMLIHDLAALSNVSIDFGKMASAAGVDGLVRIANADRVVLGSGAPLKAIEPVVVAVSGSTLTDGEKNAIRAGNARRLLPDSSLRSE